MPRGSRKSSFRDNGIEAIKQPLLPNDPVYKELKAVLKHHKASNKNPAALVSIYRMVDEYLQLIRQWEIVNGEIEESKKGDTSCR